MIPFVILVAACVSLILLFVSQRRIVARLWRGQMSSVIAPSSATFSDVLSLVSFSLTITALFAGWYSISLQAVHSNREAKIKATTDANTAYHEQISRLVSHASGNYGSGVDLHLAWPLHDLRLISTELPELRWKFARAGAGVDYLIEMVWMADPSLPDEQHYDARKRTYEDHDERCDFMSSAICFFRASEANAESTYIPLRRQAPEGRYLWRVVPLNASLLTQGNENAEESALSGQALSNWSEFGSFCFYKQAPSPSGCDLASEISFASPATVKANQNRYVVVVGTSYSDNVEFSWIRSGMRGGHDIDLIRLIVEHCIRGKGEQFAFDAKACFDAADAYRNEPSFLHVVRPLPVNDLGTVPVIAFKNFQSVDEGLSALGRKEIDLFIGSLTRAKERERAGIRLTDGYYPLRTALILPAGQPDGQELSDWLRTNRTVGVIQGSTNQWLAKKLSEMPSFEGRLTIVAFPSFASLKEAFDVTQRTAGGLDGVVLDNVLARGLGSVSRRIFVDRPLPEVDIYRTAGWKEYLTRLGSDQEEFAIAVADDEIAPTGARIFWKQLFGVQVEKDGQSLFGAIQESLRSPAIQDVLPCIRHHSALPERPDSADSNGSKPVQDWCASFFDQQ